MSQKSAQSPLAVAALEAMEHPTPFMVFDSNQLRVTYKKVSQMFAGAAIHYAMKCNPDERVLRILNHEGCGFEIASNGELQQLLSIGVHPDNIIFSAPVKIPDHITSAFKAGISHFAYDSETEITKIAEHAPGSNVYLRVIVDDSASVFPLSEKFGCLPTEAKGLALKAQQAGLKVCGLTFHVGSYARNVLAWADGLKVLKPIVRQLKDLNISLDFINIGGGFPVTYTQPAPEISAIATAIKTQWQELDIPETKMKLEPGRLLVADSAVLATTVISRVARRGHEWLYLDAGTYQAVYEVMTFQGGMQFSVQAAQRPVSIEMQDYIVAGPTCDSIDVIARGVRLPQDMKVGDRVYIEKIGAYSLALASNFNGFRLPEAYFI